MDRRASLDPATDTLSYTVTDRWINVQWLFDVVFYLLHQLGGPTLLILARRALPGSPSPADVSEPRLYVGPLAATLTGLVVVIISGTLRRPEMSYLLIESSSGCTPRRRDARTPPVARAARDDGGANCHALFIIGGS
jgi:hypothetical protein